jgi:hypothetical protein
MRWVGIGLIVVSLGCGSGSSTDGRGGGGAPGTGGAAGAGGQLGGAGGTAGHAGTGGHAGAGGAAGHAGAGGVAGHAGAGGAAGHAGAGGAAGAQAGAGGAAGSGGAGGFVCSDLTIPSCSGTPNGSASNGWLTSGTWHGYATDFASGFGNYIIAPAGFDQSGNYLCTAGSVGSSTDPQKQAGFSWNVNQDMSSPTAPAMTVTPTGWGLAIDAPGTTASMRVTLDDGSTSWCASLPAAGGGMIQWSSFRQECWPGGSGTPYAMQPFSRISIAAVSRETDPTCFCFCVTSLGVVSP